MSYPFGQGEPNFDNEFEETAFLYARVSTFRQAESNLSIPDQLDSMRKFCADNGIRVVGVYEDARTGRNMDRHSVAEIIELIESGAERVSMILVHSFSRMARNILEFELLKHKLEKYGVKIISITQRVEDSAAGDMMRQFYNIFDQYHSSETAKHVMRTQRLNAQRGCWNGGTPPFGYYPTEAGMDGKRVVKKLAVDPNEAEDVRLIFALYFDGDGKSGPMGVKKVAQWMNANGRSRRGKHWTTWQLHRVLTDTIYIGEHVFGKSKPEKEQIIVRVPAIVEAAIFNKVQARLRKHHPMKTAPRKVASTILLTGTARCGHCGGGMILATGKSNQYRYYTCSNHKRKGKSVCEGQNVPMKELDGIVTEVLACALDDESRSHQVLETLSQRMDARNIDEKSRAAELQRTLKEKEQTVIRLYQGVGTGLFDPNDELFKDQYQAACSERDIVRAKLDALTQDKDLRTHISPLRVEEFGVFLRSVLRNGPVAFRKRYIQIFLQGVVVLGDTIQIIPKDSIGELAQARAA